MDTNTTSESMTKPAAQSLPKDHGLGSRKHAFEYKLSGPHLEPAHATTRAEFKETSALGLVSCGQLPNTYSQPAYHLFFYSP